MIQHVYAYIYVATIISFFYIIGVLPMIYHHLIFIFIEVKMMSKIVIYLLAIGLALSSQIDLKDELLKARNDIEAANVAQMVAGAKSSRMHRKKFTAE